jgi:serine/threonine protein kinase
MRASYAGNTELATVFTAGSLHTTVRSLRTLAALYKMRDVPADGGIRFGQYVLLRRIARGGMAEVFLAQQRGLEGFDRRVAVKRILPHLADSPDFVKMFLGEAKLAALLSHPNVVHIYDFGKVEHDYFIAMEYVEGIHSGQAFKMAERERERLSPTLIARIGADAATALHYAHELTNAQGQPLQLVHRDISPANIMVSYDGVVKLCDFGIAKAAALTDQLTQPGQVKGKYAYMSPEQTVAQPLDGRSDVFSLGIVLWELIAGKTIVGRGDAVEAMRAIRDGKLPSLTAAAPTTPPALVAAVNWALETKRERRCTAAELAAALEAFIKASPEIAGPMQLAQWVRTRFPRNDSTGPQTSIPVAPGQGTSASPGTMASPSTMAVPSTQASRIIPLTPLTRSVPSLVKPRGRAVTNNFVETNPPDDDTGETIIAGDKPLVRDSESLAAEGATLIVDDRKPTTPKQAIVARVSEATLIADPSHRAAVETTDRDPIDDDEFFDGETVQRDSDLRRPFTPNANAIPTQAYQVPAPPARPPVRRPPPSETTVGVGRRSLPRRRLYLAASMFGLALISFSIVLCVKSPGKQHAKLVPPAPPDAAAVVAPDATPVPDALQPTVVEVIDAPPPLRSAILKVITQPVGGTVKIGDQTRTSPAEFALEIGTYKITIELEGWQSVTREIVLDAPVDTVVPMEFTKRIVKKAPPEKEMGKLSVRTVPWSDVYIGTRHLGQAPFADKEMPVGTYTLLFKHPSKEPVRRTVTIKRNLTTKLNFNL